MNHLHAEQISKGKKKARTLSFRAKRGISLRTKPMKGEIPRFARNDKKIPSAQLVKSMPLKPQSISTTDPRAAGFSASRAATARAMA
jgi:hypothetical protein